MTAYNEELKRNTGGVLVLVCIVFAMTLAFHESSGQPAEWQPFRSMAELKMPRWFGSGTLVATDGDRGLVLSCRHVAQRVGNEVELRWLSVGQETAGEVVEIVSKAGKRRGRRRNNSFQNDLALIEADVPAGLEPVPVAEFDPDNGPWTCQGFRDGTAYSAITNKAEKKGDSIVLSALFWGGESGGAVLDKHGHLVGVIVASNTEDSHGIAANGEALRTMLEKYGKQY